MTPSGELTSEPFTRLQDISGFNVYYKPNSYRPAFWDCPKVIRDAAYGKPPRPRMLEGKQLLRFMRPIVLGLGLMTGVIYVYLYHITSALGVLGTLIGPIAVLAAILTVYFFRVRQETYSQEKELFGAFEANPDLYRDEIFKAAVSRLPLLDFFGRHVAVSDRSKLGRFEAEIIDELRKLGIRQEVTVENRGRPYLIHQYELKELNWGKWENGDSKNYVLDIAILWPERRIKYNIEIDDPSHNTRPLKDINRDEVLTDRGWFVRRLNYNFLADKSKSAKALREIISIIYFFAKYANDHPLEVDDRWIASTQNAKYRDTRKAVRLQQ